jgi:hypothetical protein
MGLPERNSRLSTGVGADERWLGTKVLWRSVANLIFDPDTGQASRRAHFDWH